MLLCSQIANAIGKMKVKKLIWAFRIFYTLVQLFQNFLFVCLTLDSSQETVDHHPGNPQVFCCLLKKQALVSEVQNNEPHSYSYLEHTIRQILFFSLSTRIVLYLPISIG